MDAHYMIKGTVTLPEGTTLIPGLDNQYRLPGGQIISVHSTFEILSSLDADDHQDITEIEANKLGVVTIDYERTFQSDDTAE